MYYSPFLYSIWGMNNDLNMNLKIVDYDWKWKKWRPSSPNVEKYVNLKIKMEICDWWCCEQVVLFFFPSLYSYKLETLIFIFIKYVVKIQHLFKCSKLTKYETKNYLNLIPQNMNKWFLHLLLSNASPYFLPCHSGTCRYSSKVSHCRQNTGKKWVKFSNPV